MKNISHNRTLYRTRAAIAAALIFFALPAAAQVNTEKLRAWDDTSAVSGALGFSLSLRSGNTEFLQYGVTGRTDVRQDWYRFFVLGEYHLLRKDGEDFSRRAFFHARLNVPLNAWLTWELFGQAENNRSTRLAQRWIAGTGPRVALMNTSTLDAYLGTAYMYEYEELSEWTEGVDEPVVNVHRWSSYLVLRLKLNDAVEAQNTVYVQPRFDAFGDYRILEEAALLVKLWENVSLRNELQYRFDSRPPSGIKEYDLSLSVGFSISF